MAYHSKDGQEFVGVRASRNGKKQIVYDASAGKRIVLTIKSNSVTAHAIDAVLREGIGAQKVLTGVLKALDKRNIAFELPQPDS